MDCLARDDGPCPPPAMSAIARWAARLDELAKVPQRTHRCLHPMRAHRSPYAPPRLITPAPKQPTARQSESPSASNPRVASRGFRRPVHQEAQRLRYRQGLAPQPAMLATTTTHSQQDHDRSRSVCSPRPAPAIETNTSTRSPAATPTLQGYASNIAVSGHTGRRHAMRHGPIIAFVNHIQELSHVSPRPAQDDSHRAPQPPTPRTTVPHEFPSSPPLNPECRGRTAADDYERSAGARVDHPSRPRRPASRCNQAHGGQSAHQSAESSSAR